jgi:hypothetical protein
MRCLPRVIPLALAMQLTASKPFESPSPSIDIMSGPDCFGMSQNQDRLPPLGTISLGSSQQDKTFLHWKRLTTSR